jgi:hypothetical protein
VLRKLGFHPSQRSETCSRNLCRVQNRKRIMRSGITNTNGNERRKHDEDWNKNIDEQKPLQITDHIYDDYAMKPRSIKPFFIRAAELLGQLMEKKVEKTSDYIRPPWYTDDGKIIDWSLCKMRKGTPKICRTELQELVNEKFNDYTKIYIDGSKKQEKLGYAEDKRPIIEAIIGAIQKLPTTG